MIEERRTFGERLRCQRERRQVTLESIAETTKISASLFAGLERGDCRRWPSGVYARSFIRSYAQAVELDPDHTAAEFERLYLASESAAAPAAPAAEAQPPLRLGLATDSGDRWYRVARQGVLALSDLALVVSLASILTLIAGGHFWICLAIASLVYQVTGRVIPQSSPLEALRTRVRRGRTLLDRPDRDVAVPGLAGWAGMDLDADDAGRID
jgi:hypothetical protein